MEEKDLNALAQTGEKAPEQAVQSEEKVEAKVEIKPYKVFGQDFSLSDPDLIDYYKTRMKMMSIKYRLVGRVSDLGQYNIIDPIKYDLVKMEKEIEETGENFYKAIALYMKKHFYFHVKIQPIADGKAKASLFLSEYVENFLGLEYIVSHIADFVDVYDDDFRIKVRKAFNLVDVAVKIDETAIPELAVLMQDCFDLELIVGGLYDMASQIFVMRLLKVLEDAGENGAKVLARYRELLANSDIEINEKFRYSSYKAFLDRAIDELGGYEKLGIDPKVINDIVKDMNKTIKSIDSTSKTSMLEIETPKEAKDDKKSAGKSSSKGGGSSSKGGSKSAGASKAKPAKGKDKKVDKKPEKEKSGGVEVKKIQDLFEKKKINPFKPNKPKDDKNKDLRKPLKEDKPNSFKPTVKPKEEIKNDEEIEEDTVSYTFDFGAGSIGADDKGKETNTEVTIEATVDKETGKVVNVDVKKETTSTETIVDEKTGEIIVSKEKKVEEASFINTKEGLEKTESSEIKNTTEVTYDEFGRPIEITAEREFKKEIKEPKKPETSKYDEDEYEME